MFLGNINIVWFFLQYYFFFSFYSCTTHSSFSLFPFFFLQHKKVAAFGNSAKCSILVFLFEYLTQFTCLLPVSDRVKNIYMIKTNPIFPMQHFYHGHIKTSNPPPRLIQ
jgi:hypothetical protein